MSRIDRRAFLKSTTLSAAGLYATRSIPALAETVKGTIALSTPLSQFSYGDVQLDDGPMKRQFEENHARSLHLDSDRMLKNFRQVAGLPAPGEDMGGWRNSAVTSPTICCCTVWACATPRVLERNTSRQIHEAD